MATTVNTIGTEAGNHVVGKVIILYGNVKAISVDGTERVLGPNSPIFAYDQIITESDGRVSITMSDPAQSQVDIGRMSHIIIDEDIFAGVSDEDVAAAAAEVEQIQEALMAENFDPTVDLEAPAAGGSAAAGGGHPVADFARVTHEGRVASGAETSGITGDTVDTIPGAPEPPDPTVDVAINAEGGLIPEGDDAVFTVTIDEASEGALLTLGLNDGTALVESDYNFTSFQYDDGSGWQDITGPITLSAGTNSLLVRTDTVADNIDEPNETFSLSAEVVNENNASATDSAEATIVDGDIPTVTVSDDIRVEGDTEIFTVTVTNAADGAGLTLNMTDGTAETQVDYNATIFEYSTDDGDSWQDISDPITLTGGNQEILVRTDTVVDDLIEGDENFFLNASLTNTGGAPVADTGEGIIIEGTVPPDGDPDPQPQPVTINVNDDIIPEGADGVFTVTIGNAPTGSQLNLGLNEGSADDPLDYNAVKFEYDDGSGWKPITGPIDIPSGDTILQVRTDTVDDTIVEIDETFFVNATISNSQGDLVADSGIGIIEDNDAPPPHNILEDDNESVSTNEDTVKTGTVLGNTTNPDGPDTAIVTEFIVAGDTTVYNAGDTATITGIGTLKINADGGYTFTPAANYNGPVPVATYMVSDGENIDLSTLTITVDPVYDPPFADDSSITVDEMSTDTSLELELPTDADNTLGELTIKVTGLPTLGTVTLANGTAVTVNQVLSGAELTGLEYDAPADYNGTDPIGTFNYSVTDPDGLSDTGTTTITVDPANDPPFADDSSITVDEMSTDTSLELELPTDADNTLGELTIKVTGLPTLGTVTLANGTAVTVNQVLSGAELTGLEYDAPADYNGSDPIGTFNYSVTDPDGLSDTGTTTITVDPANDPPFADDSSITVDEMSTDTSLELELPTDADNTLGELTIKVTGLPTLGTVTLANGTAVTVNQVLSGAELTGLEYDAPADYNGSDPIGTFNYSVTDPDGLSDTGTTTITVDPANDPPLVKADTNWILEDNTSTISGDVLSDVDHTKVTTGDFKDVADTDNDDASLTVASVAHGATAGTLGAALDGDYGKLTLNTDGTYTYKLYTEADDATAYKAVQDLDENGTLTDTFSYKATDGTDNSVSSANLAITIFGENDPPLVKADTNWILEDNTSTISGDVLSDVDHTKVTTGDFKDVADTDNDDASLTVASVAHGATAGTLGAALDGDYGKLTLNTDGTYTYKLYTEADDATAYKAVQDLDENGTLTDTFSYKATDGTDNSVSSANLAITIFGENDPPLVKADTNWILEDNTSTISGDVLSDVDHTKVTTGDFKDVADTDNDDASLTVASVAHGATAGTLGAALDGDYGKLTLNTDGTYTYKLYTEADDATAYKAVQDLDENGTLTDTFSYKATDGTDNSVSSANLAITIFGENDPPLVKADTNWILEDNTSTISGDVLSDVDHTKVTTGDFKDVADTDNDDASLTVASVAHGATAGTLGAALDGDYGKLTLNTDGTYTYKLYTEADDATAYKAVQDLDENGTLTDTFSYKATDGTDNSVSSANLAITIFGENDPPLVKADTNWILEDNTSTISGDVLSDVDHTKVTTGDFKDVADTDNDDASLTVASVAHGATAGTLGAALDGDYGKLTLNTDGTYTYKLYTEADDATAYKAVQDLDENGTLTDTFSYKATDGTDNSVSSANLAITIFGENDPPLVKADTNWILEDNTSTISGDVLSDVDHTKVTTGDFKDVADTDNDDASLTVASVAHGATAGTLGAALDGDYGKLTLNTDGTYTYKLYTEADDATAYKAVQDLDENGTLTDTFSYKATDGTDNSVSSANLAITIFGENDPPLVKADTNWILEDNTSTISGDVLSDVDHTKVTTGDFKDVADTDNDDASLTVASVAHGATAGTLGAALDGDYGKLTLNTDGTYTYKLYTEADDATAYKAVQDLDENGTLTDTFSYKATDGTDNSVSSANLAITIFGENDPPLVKADTNWILEDNTSTISGDVLSDVDHTKVTTGDFKDVADTDNDDASLTVASVAHGATAGTLGAALDGDYGKLTLNTDGTYTYKLYTEADDATAYKAVQDLDENGTLTDTFSYKATDGTDNSVSSANLAITIFGENDPPLVKADTNWILEDNTSTISGDVLSDVDHTKVTTGDFKDVADTDNDDASLTVASVAHGATAGTLGAALDGDYGKLTLNTDGTYTYKLYTEADDATAYKAVQDLDENGTLTDTFSYKATDGTDNSVSSANLAITIFGENDPPLVKADTNWILEDNTSTISGDVLSDVDHTKVTTGDFKDVADTDNDDASLTVASVAHGATAGTLGAALDGDYGKLTLNTDGTYTYKLYTEADDATAYKAVQDLDENGTLTDTFSYKATDGTDNSVSSANLAITIFGENDPPLVKADTNWILEDNTSTISGDVLSDVDHTKVTTGDFKDVADTDNDDASLTVASVAHGATAGTLGAALDGDYGKLTLNTDGTYTYKLYTEADDATAYKAVQDLDENGTLTDTFSYKATDGTDNSVSSANLAITIFGENDPPLVKADTNWILEDNTSTISGDVLSDVDHTKVTTGDFKDVADTDNDDASLTVASVAHGATAGTLGAALDGDYGKLTLNTDGTYTYKLYTEADDATAYKAVQDLDENGTLTDTFSYKATDGTDNSVSSANLAITIFGENDPPLVKADTNWILEDNTSTISGDVLSDVDHTKVTTGDFKDVADTDNDDASLTVASVAHGATAGTLGAALDGDYGKLTLNTDGTYTYKLYTEADDATAYKAVQDLDENGTLTDTFSYKATDGTDNSVSSANLAITIFGENDPPLVENQHVWMPDDTAANLAPTVAPSPDTTKGAWDSSHGYALKPSIGDDPEGDTLTVDVDLPATFDGTFWYFDGSSWNQLTGDATVLSQTEFESLHYKPDGDNVSDEITLNYTVSDGINTTSASIYIHTVERDIPHSDPVTIGEPGGSPLTSGNSHEGFLSFDAASEQFMNDAVVDDTAAVTVNLDYHPQNTTLGDTDSLPDAGKGVPADYLADFDITILVDGNYYIVNYNAAIDSNYEDWDIGGSLDTTWSLVDDADNGGKVWEASFNLNEAYLVTAMDGKDQVIGVDETQTLADYLALNLVEPGDSWTITYNDGTSGNEQARFAKTTFTYDPEDIYDITVSGSPEADLIYGGIGDDELNGAAGDDIIFGREGDDDIFGGAGDDTIFANDGFHDTIGDGGANDILDYDLGIDNLVADPDDPA